MKASKFTNAQKAFAIKQSEEVETTGRAAQVVRLNDGGAMDFVHG